MKQINDLIVVEVPKDAENITVENVCGVNNIVYNLNNLGKWKWLRWADIVLPDGEWEIIASDEMMGVTKKLDALKAAGRRTAPYDVAWRFRELVDDYQLQPTDTNQILFLKRITPLNPNDK